jgi:hypothetical protein
MGTASLVDRLGRVGGCTNSGSGSRAPAAPPVDDRSWHDLVPRAGCWRSSPLATPVEERRLVPEPPVAVLWPRGTWGRRVGCASRPSGPRGTYDLRDPRADWLVVARRGANPDADGAAVVRP